MEFSSACQGWQVTVGLYTGTSNGGHLIIQLKKSQSVQSTCFMCMLMQERTCKMDVAKQKDKEVSSSCKIHQT